jgi:hypothetical protein
MPDPAPIIVDENGHPIYSVIVKKNLTTILET